MSSVKRRWVRSKYTSECQRVSSASSATTSMDGWVVMATSGARWWAEQAPTRAGPRQGTRRDRRGRLPALVEEVLAVDHDPGDLAGGHQAAVVVDRHREPQPAALDLLEAGVGGDQAAHRGG